MKDKFTMAVVGTQNTGKTTFIRDLMNFYYNNTLYEPFTTNTVDYREKIKEEGLSINRNGDLRSQKIIFDCLADSIFNAVKDDNVKNFVSDRSVIDAYVYTEYLYSHLPEGCPDLTQEDLDLMFGKLKRIVELYDKIFYISLDNCANVEVVDDKFRDTNIEYRNEIDAIFAKTISRLDLNTNNKLDKSIRGSRNERLNYFIKSYSDSILQKKL